MTTLWYWRSANGRQGWCAIFRSINFGAIYLASRILQNHRARWQPFSSSSFLFFTSAPSSPLRRKMFESQAQFKADSNVTAAQAHLRSKFDTVWWWVTDLFWCSNFVMCKSLVHMFLVVIVHSLTCNVYPKRHAVWVSFRRRNDERWASTLVTKIVSCKHRAVSDQSLRKKVAKSRAVESAVEIVNPPRLWDQPRALPVSFIMGKKLLLIGSQVALASVLGYFICLFLPLHKIYWKVGSFMDAVNMTVYALTVHYDWKMTRACKLVRLFVSKKDMCDKDVDGESASEHVAPTGLCKHVVQWWNANDNQGSLRGIQKRLHYGHHAASIHHCQTWSCRALVCSW